MAPSTDLTSISAAIERMAGRTRPSSLSPQARLLYRALRRQGPVEVGHFESVMGQPVTDSPPLLELRRLGLVRAVDRRLVAVPRRQVVDELLGEQGRLLLMALENVLERQHRINTLNAEGDALDSDIAEQVETIELEDRGTVDGLYGSPTRARREIMAIHPGGTFDADVLRQSLRRAQANLEAGVRLRVVHQTSALAHPASVEYLAAIEELGGQVRVRPHLPFRILLVDRDAAVCSTPTDERGQDTYLVRGGRVMTLLDRIFETTWVDAVPLRTSLDEATANRPSEAALRRCAETLTEQQRTILKLLAEGETDQTIARRLGITPRTVTRRVTELYEALEVQSRFQAGAAAHRMGLV